MTTSSPAERPNYFEWNEALVEFFTTGAPEGSSIFLEVTDRNLERIAHQFWPRQERPDWSEQFLSAVRRQVVSIDSRALERLRARDAQGRPLGVAFLGALVLVATQMDIDEVQRISEKDYFSRLNTAFGTQPLGSQMSRPRFMKNGAKAEEPMWLEWAKYLREIGYLPTAESGPGAYKYINYAISQALIRGPEKRRLFQLFDERRWPEDIDPELLVGHLRRDDRLTVHLRRVLRRTGHSADAVVHAISEVFAEWCDTRDGAQRSTEAATRYLRAGLYRTADWRTGEPEYALLPMQARNQRAEKLSVEIGDDLVPLVEDRRGYYSPLGFVGPLELGRGAQYRVDGSAVIQKLVLPKRDFWVLRSDPDFPETYASLGRPTVGEHFLLLVADGLLEDVGKLKTLGLLQFDLPSRPFEGWTEFPGAMVIANFWEDATGISPDLREALIPAGGVSISVSGGLRAPGNGAWLADAPPQVRVNSFFTDTQLTVRFEDSELCRQDVEPATEVEIPWCGPGVYELMVEARGERHSRLVRLVAWNELPENAPDALGAVRLELGEIGHLEGPRYFPPLPVGS